MSRRVLVRGRGIVVLPDGYEHLTDEEINALAQSMEMEEGGTFGIMGAGVFPERVSERAVMEEQLRTQPGATGEETVLPGELKHMATRFSLARPVFERADEQVLQLAQGLGPEGYDQIAVVRPNPDDPGNFSLLYRRPGEEGFRQVSSPSTFTRGDVAEFAGQFGSVGTGVSVLGEVLLSRVPGWTGVKARLLASGVGQYVGDTIESIGERAAGRELTPAREASDQAIFSSLMASGATMPAELVGAMRGGVKRLVRQSGFLEDLGVSLDLPEEARILSKAGEALGLPPITVAELYPVYRTVLKQVEATTRLGQRESLNKRAKFYLAVKTLAEKADPGSISRGELENVVDKWTAGMLKDMNLPATKTVGSTARVVQGGLEKYGTYADELVDGLDEVVERLGTEQDAWYDIGVRKGEIRALLDGLQAPQAPKDVTPGMLDVLGVPKGEAQDQAMQGLAKGAPIPGTAASQGDLIGGLAVLEGMPDQLQAKMLVPGQAGGYQSLINLRKVATSQTSSGSLGQREIAQDMISIIDEILDNPTVMTVRGRVAASQHTRFYKAVRHANAKRKSVHKVLTGLDDRLMMEMAADKPEKLGMEMISPKFPDRIKMMRAAFYSSGQKDVWDTIRGGYVTRLTQNPSSIIKELDQYSPAVRRALFTAEEESSLRALNGFWDSMKSEPLVKLSREVTELGNEAIQALLSGSAKQVDAVVKHAGGKETPIGMAMQAGVFYRVLNESMEMVENKMVLKPEKVAAAIQVLEQSGKLKSILGEQAYENIKLFQGRASYMPGAMGAGESLQVAELGSQLVRVPLPGRIGRQLSAAGTLSRNYAFAWLFLTPQGQKWLIKASARPAIGRFQRAIEYIRPMSAAVGAGYGKAKETSEGMFPQDRLEHIPRIKIPVPELLR